MDDEPFIRRVTVQVLKPLGISGVLEAENGADAKNILAQNDVDVLITDIQMPRMNGLELVKQIRLGKTGAKPDLRTIVVTSFSTMEVVTASLALDVNGFLVKPISAEDAAGKIGVAIQEQMSLRRREDYLSVDTDLQSLAQAAAEESKKTDASMVRKEEDQAIREAGGRELPLEQLEPGMHLLEDIDSVSGLTLISAGQKLTESLINRINELKKVIAASVVRVS
ncbi:MAG: response regulator [Sedimenticola sp.]